MITHISTILSLWNQAAKPSSLSSEFPQTLQDNSRPKRERSAKLTIKSRALRVSVHYTNFQVMVQYSKTFRFTLDSRRARVFSCRTLFYCLNNKYGKSIMRRDFSFAGAAIYLSFTPDLDFRSCSSNQAALMVTVGLRREAAIANLCIVVFTMQIDTQSKILERTVTKLTESD